MEPLVRRLSVGAIHHPVSVVLRLINRMKEHVISVGVGYLHRFTDAVF
jgi:hypothetical protein